MFSLPDHWAFEVGRWRDEGNFEKLLNRNSERIPRSLLELSGNPATGAAGLASESKIK